MSIEELSRFAPPGISYRVGVRRRLEPEGSAEVEGDEGDERAEREASARAERERQERLAREAAEARAAEDARRAREAERQGRRRKKSEEFPELSPHAEDVPTSSSVTSTDLSAQGLREIDQAQQEISARNDAEAAGAIDAGAARPTDLREVESRTGSDLPGHGVQAEVEGSAGVQQEVAYRDASEFGQPTTTTDPVSAVPTATPQPVDEPGGARFYEVPAVVAGKVWEGAVSAGYRGHDRLTDDAVETEIEARSAALSAAQPTHGEGVMGGLGVDPGPLSSSGKTVYVSGAEVGHGAVYGEGYTGPPPGHDALDRFAELVPDPTVSYTGIEARSAALSAAQPTHGEGVMGGLGVDPGPLSSSGKTVYVSGAEVGHGAVYGERYADQHNRQPITLPGESFVPGYDLARAAQDGRITGVGEWADVGLSALDFLPATKLLKPASTVLRTSGRLTLPPGAGGGYLPGTTPFSSVPSLKGPATSQEVVDASLEARRQLAATGQAQVNVGGRTYTFQGDRLDESLRRANPDAPAISYTAAPNVDVFAEGGPVPTLQFPPDGRIAAGQVSEIGGALPAHVRAALAQPPNPRAGTVKPASEQYQFRSVGGPVPKFSQASAFGQTGTSPGLVAYASRLDELEVPGSPSQPLGVNYYHGRELELGAATGTELPAVSAAAGAGPTFGTRLYLPEGVNLPGFGERTRANFLTLMDTARRRRLASSETASVDDVARAKFNQDYSDLTPKQARQVDVARMSDDQLSAVARGDGADAVTATKTIEERAAFSGAADSYGVRPRTGDGAQRAVYEPASGLYVVRDPEPGLTELGRVDPPPPLWERVDPPPPPPERVVDPPPPRGRVDLPPPQPERVVDPPPPPPERVVDPPPPPPERVVDPPPPRGRVDLPPPQPERVVDPPPPPPERVVDPPPPPPERVADPPPPPPERVADPPPPPPERVVDPPPPPERVVDPPPPPPEHVVDPPPPPPERVVDPPPPPPERVVDPPPPPPEGGRVDTPPPPEGVRGDTPPPGDVREEPRTERNEALRMPRVPPPGAPRTERAAALRTPRVPPPGAPGSLPVPVPLPPDTEQHDPTTEIPDGRYPRLVAVDELHADYEAPDGTAERFLVETSRGKIVAVDADPPPSREHVVGHQVVAPTSDGRDITSTTHEFAEEYEHGNLPAGARLENVEVVVDLDTGERRRQRTRHPRQVDQVEERARPRLHRRGNLPPNSEAAAPIGAEVLPDFGTGSPPQTEHQAPPRARLHRAEPDPEAELPPGHRAILKSARKTDPDATLEDALALRHSKRERFLTSIQGAAAGALERGADVTEQFQRGQEDARTGRTQYQERVSAAETRVLDADQDLQRAKTEAGRTGLLRHKAAALRGQQDPASPLVLAEQEVASARSELNEARRSRPKTSGGVVERAGGLAEQGARLTRGAGEVSARALALASQLKQAEAAQKAKGGNKRRKASSKPKLKDSQRYQQPTIIVVRESSSARSPGRRGGRYGGL